MQPPAAAQPSSTSPSVAAMGDSSPNGVDSTHKRKADETEADRDAASKRVRSPLHRTSSGNNSSSVVSSARSALEDSALTDVLPKVTEGHVQLLTMPDVVKQAEEHAERVNSILLIGNLLRAVVDGFTVEIFSHRDGTLSSARCSCSYDNRSAHNVTPPWFWCGHIVALVRFVNTHPDAAKRFSVLLTQLQQFEKKNNFVPLVRSLLNRCLRDFSFVGELNQLLVDAMPSNTKAQPSSSSSSLSSSSPHPPSAATSSVEPSAATAASSSASSASSSSSSPSASDQPSMQAANGAGSQNTAAASSSAPTSASPTASSIEDSFESILRECRLHIDPPSDASASLPFERVPRVLSDAFVASLVREPDLLHQFHDQLKKLFQSRAYRLAYVVLKDFLPQLVSSVEDTHWLVDETARVLRECMQSLDSSPQRVSHESTPASAPSAAAPMDVSLSSSPSSVNAASSSEQHSAPQQADSLPSASELPRAFISPVERAEWQSLLDGAVETLRQRPHPFVPVVPTELVMARDIAAHGWPDSSDPEHETLDTVYLRLSHFERQRNLPQCLRLARLLGNPELEIKYGLALGDLLATAQRAVAVWPAQDARLVSLLRENRLEERAPSAAYLTLDRLITGAAPAQLPTSPLKESMMALYRVARQESRSIVTPGQQSLCSRAFDVWLRVSSAAATPDECAKVLERVRTSTYTASAASSAPALSRSPLALCAAQTIGLVCQRLLSRLPAAAEPLDRLILELQNAQFDSTWICRLFMRVLPALGSRARWGDMAKLAINRWPSKDVVAGMQLILQHSGDPQLLLSCARSLSNGVMPEIRRVSESAQQPPPQQQQAQQQQQQRAGSGSSSAAVVSVVEAGRPCAVNDPPLAVEAKHLVLALVSQAMHIVSDQIRVASRSDLPALNKLQSTALTFVLPFLLRELPADDAQRTDFLRTLQNLSLTDSQLVMDIAEPLRKAGERMLALDFVTLAVESPQAPVAGEDVLVGLADEYCSLSQESDRLSLSGKLAMRVFKSSPSWASFQRVRQCVPSDSWMARRQDLLNFVSANEQSIPERQLMAIYVGTNSTRRIGALVEKGRNRSQQLVSLIAAVSAINELASDSEPLDALFDVITEVCTANMLDDNLVPRSPSDGAELVGVAHLLKLTAVKRGPKTISLLEKLLEKAREEMIRKEIAYKPFIEWLRFAKRLYVKAGEQEQFVRMLESFEARSHSTKKLAGMIDSYKVEVVRSMSASSQEADEMEVDTKPSAAAPAAPYVAAVAARGTPVAMITSQCMCKAVLSHPPGRKEIICPSCKQKIIFLPD